MDARELYDAGRAHMKAGRLQEAADALQQSAAVEPHFKTLELLGECRMLLGENTRAVAPLAAATTLNRQGRAPALLAEVFERLNDAERAAEMARLALERDRGNARARGVLSRMAATTSAAQGAERAAGGDTYRIDDQVSPEDERAVGLGLLAFNEARVGPAREQPVRLVVRDSAGAVVGGLIGHTRWSWLYVGKLWLDEKARGQDVGTRLMLAAEDIARSRGCTHASVDTFEYQARPFYEKLGYALFGTLEGYPPGYRQYHLTKRLEG